MSTLRILLIEDNPFFQTLWESIIGRATASAYTIDWANTDFIAEEMLENNKYDIIISDIILTGSRTGFDIWKKYDSKDCCFIFSSSMPIEHFYECLKQFDKKPHHFIPKPLKINDCSKYIANVILKHQRLVKNKLAY
jgi:DNA-binding NtrC family response regulator